MSVKGLLQYVKFKKLSVTHFFYSGILFLNAIFQVLNNLNSNSGKISELQNFKLKQSINNQGRAYNKKIC